MELYEQPSDDGGGRSAGFSKSLMIGLVLGGVLLLAGGVFAGYYFATQQVEKPAEPAEQQEPGFDFDAGNAAGDFYEEYNDVELDEESFSDVKTEEEKEGVEEVIDGQAYAQSGADPDARVEWLEPKEIEPSRIFYPDYLNDGAVFLRVGVITAGRYAAGDVITVKAPCDGMCFQESFYVMIRDDDKFYMLDKYSDDFSENQENITIDKDYTLFDLEYSETMIGNREGALLYYDLYPREIFDEKYLKKEVFIPEVGDVYTTADNLPDDAFGLFTKHGFYFRGKDGLAHVYKMQPEFVDEYNYPKVTWNDQSENQGQYAYTDVTGCGSQNYASVVSREEVNIDRDLVETGKTGEGERVYEFKDLNHPILRKIYDEQYEVAAPGDFQKMSYEDFVKQHPVFLWVDYFDRLIKFQNQEFLPQAECGKPVIYLYPPKTTEVSVKVDLAGGFSKTEPEYHDGWLVVAEPSGKLTEVSSGLEYPYLFWEGRGGIYERPDKGFVLERERVGAFLLGILPRLGLNARETFDFMEFWLPRMQESPYYFVTFMGNNVMNRLAPLSVEPKPDTIIRILMDFEPLDQPIEVEELKIGRAPIRKGFTVVEWGGVLR